MNVQQHARIAQIKQFSGYLYVCLTWIRYFLLLAWPAIVIFILGGMIFGDGIKADDEALLRRVVFAVFFSVFISALLFLVLQLCFHFRELIRYFSNGHIFNKGAIYSARKALLYALTLYGFCVAKGIIFQAFFQLLYSAFALPPLDFPLFDLSPLNFSLGIFLTSFDFMCTIILFSFMYILLWALEIGCDLNEESELTI